MAVDNDTRGWIMTCISGVACIIGAAVICVDVIIRVLPGFKNFNIRDSDGFLSCSLSLSAGVMLFSALNNMLPHSKSALREGGYSPSAAAWVELAAFLGGVFGIQVFTRICHHFIPHHAVDCDHTHKDEEAHPEEPRPTIPAEQTERTPLLRNPQTSDGIRPPTQGKARDTESTDPVRPPLHERVTTKVSRIVTGPKEACEGEGPCLGWSDPCNPDCFKTVSQPSTPKTPKKSASWFSSTRSRTPTVRSTRPAAEAHEHLPLSVAPSDAQHDTVHDEHDHVDTHHHHVPDNAFLSISLQTSIAIALHKLPEGFITYATNHANPTLGFSVFLALFIHNLTEGFALALPIYLATNSRVRALFLSTILGGLSQPAGAGIAALWLRATETGRGGDAADQVNQAVYGALFGVTAGIMASVAISLIQESFELSHRRDWCMVFIFLGMGILGMSNALVGGGHA